MNFDINLKLIFVITHQSNRTMCNKNAEMKTLLLLIQVSFRTHGPIFFLLGSVQTNRHLQRTKNPHILHGLALVSCLQLTCFNYRTQLNVVQHFLINQHVEKRQRAIDNLFCVSCGAWNFS